MRLKRIIQIATFAILLALGGTSRAQPTALPPPGPNRQIPRGALPNQNARANELERRGRYHEKVGLILLAIGGPITLVGAVVGGYYLLQLPRMNSDSGIGAIAGASIAGAGFLVMVTGVGLLGGGAVERRHARKLRGVTIAPSIGPGGGALTISLTY